jgi:hypothetical protein
MMMCWPSDVPGVPDIVWNERPEVPRQSASASAA